MCMVLYLGTTTDVPLIPWNEEKRAFHVAPLTSEFEKQAVHHFGELKVHYLGSHDGCGCGFLREGDFNDEQFYNEQRSEEKKTAHEALIKYLEALPRMMQIYACWSGDEAQPALTRKQICLNNLSKSEFFFREREMLVIT